MIGYIHYSAKIGL